MDYKELSLAIKFCGSKTHIRECKECPYFEGDYSGDCVTKMTQDASKAIEDLLKYKEAMERMGWFGKMFQRYAGDPRGPIGTFGNALEKFLVESCIEPARNRQVLKDVDGNAWLPMLLDEFESMADVIEHGQEWIPVEERLPEPTENPVLVHDYSGVSVAWHSRAMGWVYKTGLACVDVTHWMPLPPGPSAKGEE